MTMSRLRAEYVGNQYFLMDQELVLARQDGIERYDLEKNGTLITDYHAISFTPTNFLSIAKSLRPKGLEALTKTTPVILGALITTEKIHSPALEKGIYTVYYRHAGLPRVLVDSLREGCTVLRKQEVERIKAEKAAKRAKGKKKKPNAKKKKKKPAKKKGRRWTASGSRARSGAIRGATHRPSRNMPTSTAATSVASTSRPMRRATAPSAAAR